MVTQNVTIRNGNTNLAKFNTFSWTIIKAVDNFETEVHMLLVFTIPHMYYYWLVLIVMISLVEALSEFNINTMTIIDGSQNWSRMKLGTGS